MGASTRGRGTNAGARRGGGRAALATLAVGALLIAGGLLATLSRADVRRAGTNDVLVEAQVDALSGSHRVCQADERIPAGTAAVRVSAVREGSPPTTVGVELLGAQGQGAVAAGSAPAADFEATVVPLRPHVAEELAGQLCLELRAAAPGASILLFGEPTDASRSAVEGGRHLEGRIRFEYLRAGSESWLAFAPTVVDRVGLGHAWSGTSVALLAALLALASIGVAAWLLVREG